MGDAVKRKIDSIETVELGDSSDEEVQFERAESKSKRLNTGTAADGIISDVLLLDSDDDLQSEKKEDESEAQKCTRLVKEFILITKTDSKVAEFFLSQHDWKLEIAVNDFLNLSGDILGDEKNSALANTLKNEPWAKNVASSSEVKGTFSFISWNVDGLDKRNLSPRTANLIKILTQEAPDIVFLQEVVPETIDVLKSNLSKYQFVVQDYPNLSEAYFVTTLVKKDTVKVLSQKDVSYSNTLMMRGLLSVEVEVANIKMWLLNTHLESTAQYKKARVDQLKQVFNDMSEKSRTHHVLFAGDLNLRDTELPLAGGIPSGALDLWEACDKREACKFTWDAARNSNIQFGNFGSTEGNSKGTQFKPRLRFDRAYLSVCKKDKADRVVANHFGLVGIAKVPNMQCYTSDHWGLQVYFTLNKC
ncbi:tyrosyl-DNA phosphodiesterase 2-like [Neocloeon triangulifer]|uniref:tyrosyl-DNA phosphodiesterase 2-like n=1 Tax=Neocloeon triangulifer TaxID=2078957 RepID=UPI00286F3F59|nr:tyrosyl-DNA phosphodiesterase 2-like [Neocloeon triangulifer]